MAYRSSGEARDLDIDSEVMLAAQRRRRNRTLLALGACAGLLAVVSGAATYLLAKRGSAENQLAWDRLATCLVGDPTALASDTPAARVRNGQLASMVITPEQRATAGASAWPERCGALAHAMSETLRANGDSEALAVASEQLAKAVAAPGSVTANLAPLVSAVFVEAAAGRFVPRKADGVPAPDLLASAPMTLATLPKAAILLESTLLFSSLFPAPFGETTLRFVVDEKGISSGPAVCSFVAASRTIECRKVPPPASQVSPALRPWGTTEEGTSPFVFAGDRGRSGVFRSDSGAVVVDKLEHGAYGASVLEGGAFAYLTFDEKRKETRLVHLAANGASRESKVAPYKESGNPYYTTSIFWRDAFYKSIKKPADGIRLVTRHIEADGSLGPATDIGRIDEQGRIEGRQAEQAHLTACRAGDTKVVRAKGWRNTYLSFFVQGRWSPPVESRGTSGQLQCRPGEAIITNPWGGLMASRFKGGVAAEHCTVSGCRQEVFDLAKSLSDVEQVLPRSLEDLKTMNVGGKLLVVWRAGDHGGLRMRFAPIDRIGAIKDTVLYDDHWRNGTFSEESTLVGLQLFPVTGGALLLLGTVEGVFAWLVDESGQSFPVTTRLN